MQTRVLFLDDSGKPDANHPSAAVVIAGFSLPADAVPTLARRVLGTKATYFSQRGQPTTWEVKAGDQPTFRDDAFSHRNAYTSSRPTNNDRNNATFCARVIGSSPKVCVFRLFDASPTSVVSTNRVGSHAVAGPFSASRSKPNNDRSRSFSDFNASISTMAATSRASPLPSSADRIKQGYGCHVLGFTPD